MSDLTVSPGHAAAPVPGSRIVTLDGLRGIAAICVVMLHAEAVVGQTGPFSRSYLAVDFFFMLSGFVMVRVIETERTASAIMLARIARFWPLMACGTLLGLLIHGATSGPGVALPFLLPALACIPSVAAPLFFPLNAPQWSLIVELVANLAHALVLRRLGVPALLAISAACWLGLTIGIKPGDGLNLGAEAATWTGGLLRCGFAYPLGCALGRLKPISAPRLAAAWWLAPALLPAVLVAPKLLGVPAHLADPAVLLAFVPVLVLGTLARPGAHAATRLHWLGAISFPLYAIHFPLIEGGRWLALQLPHGYHALPQLAALALSFVLAHRLSQSWLARGFKVRERGAASRWSAAPQA